MKRIIKPMVTALALLAASAVTGRAQELPGTIPEAAVHEGHREDAAHGGSEGHEGHARNALAVILGATYESEEDRTFFTIGVEYERLVRPTFAVVAGAEYLTDADAWVAAVPLFYRHPSGWRLGAGPGLELKPRRPHLERPHGDAEAEQQEVGAHASEIGDRIPRGDDTLFLWRFAVAHSFHVGKRYAVAPAAYVDLVREEGEWVWAGVFAVAVGFDF